MKKTNFVLSRATGMRASVYTALKYTLLLLIFTISVPSFGQSVPKLVDRDVAITKLQTLVDHYEQYLHDMISSKDEIKDAQLRKLADRYEAKFTKLYGFTNKAKDAGTQQVEMSYQLHLAILKALGHDPNLSTEDAVRHVMSAKNIYPKGAPVSYNIDPKQEGMRDEIMSQDIIPFLAAN